MSKFEGATMDPHLSTNVLGCPVPSTLKPNAGLLACLLQCQSRGLPQAHQWRVMTSTQSLLVTRKSWSFIKAKDLPET